MEHNHKAPLLTLVPSAAHPNRQDLIESLTWLLQEAAAGRITGLAFAAIMPNREYVVETVGEAHANPLFTLGVLRVLDSELTRKVAGR